MANGNREIIYDVEKVHGLTLNELRDLLLHWQVKLKMEEWKLDIKIVEFRRANGYRQSGDFIAEPDKKEATILMTNNPWRGDEEYTLVHEMIHVILCGYDKYSEGFILKNFNDNSDEHDNYMEKLEDVAHHLTRIILGRSDR